MTSHIACAVFAVASLFAVPLAAQSESPDSLALDRKFTGWFLDGYSDSLWNMIGEGFSEEGRGHRILQEHNGPGHRSDRQRSGSGVRECSTP